MFIAQLLAFLIGLALVFSTLSAATRTLVLPRGANVRLTRLVFQLLRKIFDLRVKAAPTFQKKDQIMALYAPLTLLLLPIVWLTLVLFGFMGMYWSFGVQPWEKAFLVSGSSLLTLGFAPVETLPQTILAFLEATIGLGLVALMIAYLPTMYAAFSKREAAVALLEVYAGSPPSALELISRIDRIRGLDYMGELWSDWETWFAEIEESHTSLAALSFFRSPTSDRSWVTAAGTVLDAAALAASTLDIPIDPRANLTIRAGYLALRRIGDFFQIPYNPDPQPNDPICISQREFDIAYDHLAKAGVPLKPDRNQAWQDFSGWRVNYDYVLLSLAALTMAPKAPWTSDRAPIPPAIPKTPEAPND
jgi:hypothetical protein